MTDVDDYMAILKESQLKRTIIIKDIDKIILENKQLKELLKECRRPVCWYVDIFKNKAELLTKIDEVLK